MNDKIQTGHAYPATSGSVVWFTMVELPTGWIRCGNAYSSKEEAEDWLHFVSESRGGLPAKVEKLRLNFVDGMLDEETIRVLDEKFNLDAPNEQVQPPR